MKLDRRLTAKKLQPATARFLDLTARKIYDLDRKWDPAKGTPVFIVEGALYNAWLDGVDAGLSIRLCHFAA